MTGVALMLGLTVLSGCSSSSSIGPSVAAGPVCSLVDRTLFYPTVPLGGEHISKASAMAIETLLRRSPTGALRDKAVLLQRAISTDDEAAMLAVVSNVQDNLCPPLGYPPAT